VTDTVPRLTAALADRYTIERQIGAGGMATVFLAEDVKHRRKVARTFSRSTTRASRKVFSIT
jgi:serine/threonine-protein kinase